MRIIHFCFYCLFFSLIFSACKTTQVVQQDEPVKKPIPQATSELRGLMVSSKYWDNRETEEIKKFVEEAMVKASEANYNAIFLEYSQQTLSSRSLCMKSGKIDPGFDALDFGLQTAHEHGLKFYLVIDLLQVGETGEMKGDASDSFYKNSAYGPVEKTWLIMDQNRKQVDINGAGLLNPAIPQVKTYLKQSIRCITENYDIDGFSFDQLDYPNNIISYDKSSSDMFYEDSLRFPVTRKEWMDKQLRDLIEDVVVEAMLVKPYLVNSMIIPSGDSSSSPYAWLHEGIIDLLIPGIQNKGDNTMQMLQDYWNNLTNKNSIAYCIYPMLTLDENIPSNIQNINFEHGSRGMVWTPGDLESKNSFPEISLFNYAENINYPDSLKRVSPKQVFGLDFSALLDEDISGQLVYLLSENKTKFTDSNGSIGFVSLDADTLKLEINDQTINQVYN